MDFQVALNKLKFGQEDGAGINARVAGRLDGIEALAANLYAVGQIENLVVKRCDGDFFSVSNGNRRLAAFRQIHGDDSDALINCTLRDVNEAQAFEDSLITAVTAKQLHPVDQYEAFARLEENGKNNEEIARLYGMTEKEVRQALALGRLSPKIRDAWRRGEIKAEVARAFTLGSSHKAQDKVFAALEKVGHLYESNIKKELGASDAEISDLLGFVGIEFYRTCGGEVTEDLFGTSHIVSKPELLKQLAADKLAKTGEDLRAEGWSWAELISELPQGARWWAKAQPKKLIYEGDEEQRLAALRSQIEDNVQKYQDGTDDNFDDDEANAPLIREISEIEAQVARRSFSDRQKAGTGCILIFDDGVLDITFGVIKPAQVVASDEKAAPAAKESGAVVAAVPEEPAISQALLQRLSLQLTEGAALALSQDVELSLIVLLAGLASRGDYEVKVHASGLQGPTLDLTGAYDVPDNIRLLRDMKVQDRLALLAPVAAAALDFRGKSLADPHGKTVQAVCNEIEPKSLNAALRGAFDAKDYFDGVAKALALQAIEEALGPDIARQQGKNKRPEIAAFAFANVPPTGWLPIQLRAKGYDGPPVVKPAPVPIDVEIDAPAPTKKAAAAKKAAKKISAKPAKKPVAKKVVKKAAAKPAGKKPAKKAASKKKKA